jgi:hypothetical protein
LWTLADRAEFGHAFALGSPVKQFKSKKPEKTTMAMEKKSLVSKKTAAPTKSKSVKSKVDTSKPAATKVVSASNLKNKVGW